MNIIQNYVTSYIIIYLNKQEVFKLIMQPKVQQPQQQAAPKIEYNLPVYLNTSLIRPQNSEYSHLLYLISSHPSFKSKVNSFLLLFPPEIPIQGLIKMGTLIQALLLPELPTNLQRKLAVQLFNSLQTHHDTVTYTNLSQYLLKICSDVVENIDVRSAIGILQLIQSRITDHYIISAKDPSIKRKIQVNMKLQIFDSEQILSQTELPEKFHRRASQLIYFEEKVQFQEDLKLQPWQVVTRKLKQKPQQVIPLGFVHEQFCFDYLNNNFQTRNNYRLKPNKYVEINDKDKIQYWVTLNGMVGNSIRDKVVNTQTYYNCPIIGISHLPQSINPSAFKIYNLYRINQAFLRISYYQRLKQVTQKQSNTAPSKFFNVLSQFYDRDQFNIDQLTLTKQKFLVRRKEQALGIQGKETVKKEVKDFDDQARLLPQKINKFKFQFLVQKRRDQTIKDLHKNLRHQLQQDKNINVLIQKYLSANENLPKDSIDTFKQDIIELSKKNPLQILILGRAKSGKTSLAKVIAKQYNISHLSIQTLINKVIQRSNFFKENPPQADEDGNIKGGLLKIQQCILEDLENGRKVQEQDLLDLLNIELKKQTTQSRGYILDLPLQYSPFWYEAIIGNKIYIPKVGCRFFNRIIQIDQTQQQWTNFVKGQLSKPEDLTTYSSLDRYFRSKPKPPLEQGQQQPPQQQQKPAPLVQGNMIKIVWQNSVMPLIQHLTNQINPLHYLKVKNSYQNNQQILALISNSLYKIPLPKKIQGNQKQLLTVGLQQQKISRKWSPWGLADCVQLSKEKLINGKFQFAAEYGGRVFVFENQNNLNLFLQNPRRFLKKLPSLPKKTNIAIAGPRKSGKKTIAKLLSQIYGLKIIDFEEILKVVLQKQKQNQSHIPSNPDRTSKAVHLSQSQFKQFTKGGLLNAKDVLPIILYELGIPLQKKPPGWGIQKNEEEGGAPQQPVQQKKAPPKKAKKKQKTQDQRPKTPPLQDLSLKQIIPVVNFKGKLDETKGFILIGYPHNEEQLNALKSFNIPIDKFILLSDNTEQNPFKTLSKRLTDSQMQQVANFITAIGPIKQSLGQQNFKQITNLEQTPNEIVNKIRQFIDPFYPKCDQDSLNRVTADKQEDGDPIPMGFCGNFCPVTLNNKWLVKGKDEFEAGFQGKRFKLAGESQLNAFKQNPTNYIKKQNLLIPPRIMFIGLRGVGLKTQLLKLNQAYKIPILNFKQTLLQQLENQKHKRKSERYYNKGFKVPQYNQEGNIIQDPQLNQQSPDFNRAQLEVEVVKRMFSGINQIFINGNYYEVEQQAVQTPFVDLLANARKLPEAVVILKSDQAKWLQRNLDKKKIQQQLQQIKRKRREQKRKERQQAIEQAKQKAQEAGQQYQQPPPEQYNEQQDPQIPKLQQMISQKQQALKSQRQNDSGKLQQLMEAFKTWNVDVIQVKCQRQQKHVNDRIVSAIKPYLQDRINKWEQNNMLPIQRHRVKDFLNNYIALQSRFGQLNPFTYMRPVLPYPLIYNDRIYYLKDEQQRQSVMRNPKLLETNLAVPDDIKIVPSVSVIGLPKTGKSTLAQSIHKRLGLVKLTLQNIIQQFCLEHRDKKVNEILQYVKKGNVLTDQMAVQLIQKRVSMHDCQKYGWVFDGFPSNRQQCELMNKKGLLPSNIFSIRLSENQIKKRVINYNLKSPKLQHYQYDWDIQVVQSRISQNIKDLLQIQVYFWTKFNNIKKFDGKISKWGLFQQAKAEIQNKMKNKKEFVRSLVTHSATAVSNIGLNFNCIINNLSDYTNYCPISYKIRREYIRLCIRHYKNLALYNKKFFIFASQKQLKDFVSNPESYKNRGTAFNPPTQIFEQEVQKALPKVQNKGYCMVELTRKKLVKGCASYIIRYKEKFYQTSTAHNLKLFIKNPVLFQMIKLQDKLPVQFEKKSDLKKLAKQNDCTAFLQHHLSNILMKSLAQLGYRRPKFPTLGSKQSALKFLSISLKANNPNKDDEYRQKYSQKLQRFIKQCTYSQQIRQQIDRKNKGQWEAHEEQNLIKLCEEYNKFLNEVNSQDKNKYFSQFIR